MCVCVCVFLFFFYYFIIENRVLYELTWKNVVEPGRSHDNMAHAHFILGS